MVEVQKMELAGDLAAKARLALLRSPVFPLRQLEVSQDGNRLVITGKVQTFYHKQIAQEVVRSVAKGLRVVNSVRVTKDSAPAKLGDREPDRPRAMELAAS